jgi:hypothetical protein
MRQHLLRVTRGAEAFESLIDAARDAGERVGWLELAPPSRWPEELEAAAGRGVLRAVAVGGGRSVAVKPMRGEPMLRDLLREHFRGCALVLLRGEPRDAASLAAPRLEPHGESWAVRCEGGPERLLTTDQLLAALRRPHPWGRPAPRRRETRE